MEENLFSIYSLPVKGFGMHFFLFARVCLQENENKLVQSAASDCLLDLNHFIGPNILAGRVEMLDPK